MTRLSHNVFYILIYMMGMSCNKTMLPKTDQKLTGNWTWVQSSFGNSILNPANSGLQKKVSILSNGAIFITHNDSTNQYSELRVYTSPLLSKMIIDSETYHIESKSAGCAPTMISFLVVGTQQNYQYNVSNDSLYIMNAPCLAPLTTIYIKTP